MFISFEANNLSLENKFSNLKRKLLIPRTQNRNQGETLRGTQEMPKETGKALCETQGNVRGNGGETCGELRLTRNS